MKHQQGSAAEIKNRVQNTHLVPNDSMANKTLYEYAVVRLSPRVERGEFLNVGIILFCRDRRYLDCRLMPDERRLRALDPTADLPLLLQYLHAFERVCKGDPAAGPMAQLGIAERFRWLTAERSTIVQTSRVHAGLCLQPEQALEYLMREYVSPIEAFGQAADL